MSAAPSLHVASFRPMQAALAAVRGHIEARLGRPEKASGPKRPQRPQRPRPRPQRAQEPATPVPNDADGLSILAERFSLSPFERDVLVLCAGVELDASFAALVAEAQRGVGVAGPTFGFALATLPGAHWSALAPRAALRRWRLVDLQPGAGVTTGLLRIDERVLHYLTGVRYFEPRLRGAFEPVPTVVGLSPSQTPAARTAVESWSGRDAIEAKPVLVLEGNSASAHEAVAATVTAALNLRLYRVCASAIAESVEERAAQARLWERESMLLRSALFLVISPDDSDEAQERALQFVGDLSGLILVSTPRKFPIRHRATIAIAVHRPDAADQVWLWRRELGPLAKRLNGAVEAVATQFRFDAPAIRRAARALRTEGERRQEPAQALWQVCRVEARTALHGLAQEIEPRASWEDLVLPEAQKQVLRTIVAQVRQRGQVEETWGFGRKSCLAVGIHALFAGPSGTGKTLAAEVIARDLSLDLNRIDLSAVVSKYIGETEKNLRRIFDAAESSGSILLFDEADALFGRRSEVRDSHDRYANIEVSYLLQRMESYRGLAILTTNLKPALDPAFSRRLRFTVHFPFPDQKHRAEIWRRIFPKETPLEGIDWEKLARLSLSGGHIRNVALNAAFLAAEVGQPVRMPHLWAAAQTEFAKLEKPLGTAEITDWK